MQTYFTIGPESLLAQHFAVGGLTLAAALHRDGVDVELAELAASQGPRWHCHQLDSGQLPYITSPHQLAAMLLQPAASSDDS